ncbi:hypothetical protein [Billgrantia ethanolica]|uniref:Uncharacterized protein n=1 Tax=Billgrantia ethanolica TaxID=2733486 RepID=A0ABS8ZZY6_9GAMM|nr:hypothetical protein [Halomonas ethanolica]MCE8002159.1 hypothetical protein [Halomonas ethanolica]
MSRKTTINDYSQQLEQLSLATEDLLKVAAIFKAVEAMQAQDPLDPAAQRLAATGRQMAERSAEYFQDSGDEVEATIEQLKADEEAESCPE